MLSEIIASLEKVIAALTNLIGAVEKNINSGLSIVDTVKNRRQQERWEELLVMLQKLATMQADVPGMLREMANRLATDPSLQIQMGQTPSGGALGVVSGYEPDELPGCSTPRQLEMRM